MNRLLEFMIVALWLTSMALLVSRDAVPRWFATDPPDQASASWLLEQGDRFQYGIFDPNGLSKGACWTLYRANGGTISRDELVVLEGLPVIGRLAIRSQLTFLNEHELVSVDVEITGVHAPLKLHGERQGPKFAYQLKIGTTPAYEFVLDSDAARMLCDIVKPFSAMRGLQVGQAWKIHVLDPLTLIRNSPRSKPKAVVATVTGEESIQVQGVAKDCFVVDAPGARAWVDHGGRVVRQLVTVPGMGQLEIREQTFQQGKYEDMTRLVRGF